MARRILLMGLLACAAPTVLCAQPEPQSPRSERAAPGPAADDENAVDELVVKGQRPRGSVIGDIPPEQTLQPADIRSFGVSSINDLLSELAPETTSGRGGAPVVLLGGRRISGLGELRDIPTEAIARLEILPEEVALKYGYSADQKVVNIVLRTRFRATTTQASVAEPTEGGQTTVGADASVLKLNRDGRLNLGIKYQHADALLEADRGVASQAGSGPYDLVGNVTAPVRGGEVDPALSALAGRPVTTAGVPLSARSSPPALADFRPDANVSDLSHDRSLLPATQQLSINGVVNRTVFENVSATLNATVSATTSDSLLGPAQAQLSIPAGDPFSPFGSDVILYRSLGELGPLHQASHDVAGHLGATLDGDVARWRWNLTAVYDHDQSRTDTDRTVDLTGLQAQLDALDPAANPFAPLAATPFQRQWATSISDSGSAELLLTGAAMRLPAGDLSTSITLGASATRLDAAAFRAGVESQSALSRAGGKARLNLDLPIASTRNGVLPALGDLSANVNLALDRLSDFGSLTTWGGGLTWTPRKPVNFIVSYTDASSAPSMAQLGAPSVLTPDSREFDFRTGQTLDVVRVSGGNPDLRAEKRRTLKLGVTVRPPQVDGLSATANYFRTRIRDPIAAFPIGVAAVEDAFPDRFTRDASGLLQRVDARPVNYAEQESDLVRWGFNFSRFIGKAPPPPTPDQLAALREAFEARRRQAAGQDGAPEAPARPGQAAETPGPRNGPDGGPGGGPDDRPRFGPGGPRGFGGPGGPGGGRARLQLAVYHTVHLREDILIRPGMPVLDLLHGGSVSAAGGEPQQEVELQAGLTKSGLGARLSAKWQSATTVDGGAGPASRLSFSDLTTVNLRLFMDFAGRREFVQAHPFLRGARVAVSVTNLFDRRLDVRDATGATPLRYQAAYLDPLGRSVQLTFRKLFFPQFPAR